MSIHGSHSIASAESTSSTQGPVSAYARGLVKTYGRGETRCTPWPGSTSTSRAVSSPR
jgi:hypothetical protein